MSSNHAKYSGHRSGASTLSPPVCCTLIRHPLRVGSASTRRGAPKASSICCRFSSSGASGAWQVARRRCGRGAPDTRQAGVRPCGVLKTVVSGTASCQHRACNASPGHKERTSLPAGRRRGSARKAGHAAPGRPVSSTLSPVTASRGAWPHPTAPWLMLGSGHAAPGVAQRQPASLFPGICPGLTAGDPPQLGSGRHECGLRRAPGRYSSACGGQRRSGAGVGRPRCGFRGRRGNACGRAAGPCGDRDLPPGGRTGAIR